MNKLKLAFTAILVTTQTLVAQPKCNQYNQFKVLNKDIDLFYEIGQTHQIAPAIDASKYFTEWKRRHFLFNGRFFGWKYEDYISTYNVIGDVYVRNGDPKNAKFFAKRILTLDPEYFYHDKNSSLKHLFKRFTGLKFVLGFYGIGAFTNGRLTNDRAQRKPEGSRSSNENLKTHWNLKSSFVAGVELIHNPAISSWLRSLDLYTEYMIHSDRFVHQIITEYPATSINPSTVKNEIVERQDWRSLLIYPRARFSINQKWTFNLFAGIGINYLRSADFFEIFQETEEYGKQELSPIKLYKKEQMRRNKNTSVIGGIGFDYRIARNISLNLQGRYLKMTENIVTDFSIENRPLEGPPVFYVDNDIKMHQISGSIGLSISIGSSPRWLRWF